MKLWFSFLFVCSLSVATPVFAASENRLKLAMTLVSCEDGVCSIGDSFERSLPIRFEPGSLTLKESNLQIRAPLNERQLNLTARLVKDESDLQNERYLFFLDRTLLDPQGHIISDANLLLLHFPNLNESPWVQLPVNLGSSAGGATWEALVSFSIRSGTESHSGTTTSQLEEQ